MGVRRWCAAAAAAALVSSGALAESPDAEPDDPDAPDAAATLATYRGCRDLRDDEWRPECREAFRQVDQSEWRRGGTVSFIWENDAIVGPDRDYTNGVGLIISEPPRDARDEAHRLEGLHSFFDKAFYQLVFKVDGAEGRHRATYRMGHHLYTPEDLLRVAPDPEDRPYAAWWYVGGAHIRETDLMPPTDQRRRVGVSSLQVDAGIVGPSAGGERLQRDFHTLINADVDPQGWGRQLHDELAFVVRLERKVAERRALGASDFEIEWSYFAGLAAGNVDTSANLGVGGRLGWNMGSDYGPSRLRPGIEGSSYFVRDADSLVGGYLFVEAATRAVAWNMFLDGNTFGDSPSVDKRGLVGDTQVGGAVIIGPVRLSLSHVWRGEEFYGQARDSEFDSFGFSLRF